MIYTVARTVRNALCVLFISIGLASFAVPAIVHAEDILDEACATAPDSPTCKSNQAGSKSNPLTGKDGILYKVSQIIAIIAGIAAVIVVIVSGIRYITSGGDSQKTASAKNTLVGALIGLIIIVLAQTIITFVIKRL